MITKTEAETELLGAQYGKKARAGEIYTLSGEPGAGKTAFVRGFAAGAGYTGYVTSPTFTILNIYDGKLPLYHFDLYRLKGGLAELEGIGYEEYFYGEGVSLVEWPELAPEAVPIGAICIKIEIENADRIITVMNI